MAGTNVAPSPDALDPAELAKGIGKVEHSSGYARILTPDGTRTIAYVRRRSISIPSAHAPKKLPDGAKAEGNGRWHSIPVADTAMARDILGHVLREVA